MKYNNELRTHLSLEKDAPVPHAVARAGTFFAVQSLVDNEYVRTLLATDTPAR
jgi:hypothetical protein